jgi:hypothetical protein
MKIFEQISKGLFHCQTLSNTPRPRLGRAVVKCHSFDFERNKCEYLLCHIWPFRMLNARHIKQVYITWYISGA